MIYSRQAAKDLDALPADAAVQVMDSIESYAMTGVGDVTALADRPGLRLRTGRYRVVFLEDRITVVAIKVTKRETTTYRRGGR